MKKWTVLVSVLACCLLVLCAGCSHENGEMRDNRDQPAYAVITDDMGRTVSLAEKPRRVVVLSTSLLNFAAALDGEVAGRATVKSEDADLPEAYAGVPEVGPVYNISVEKIVALQPDLVIASEVQHRKFIPLLEKNGIPVIALRSKTYEDVKRNMNVFGQVYGKEAEAAAKNKAMDQAVAAITAKLPQAHKKVAIIHATPSSVTVQLSGSIAGDVARILGLENVAASVGDGTVEKVPYSMEALVEKDPDIIFFTSMGETEKIESRIRKDVESNPAWASLRAVQEGNVYILPERYFLLNPGLQYPDAVAYMARLAYPEAKL